MLLNEKKTVYVPARRTSKGITLVEVLAAITIVAVVSAVFYGVFMMNWLSLEGYIVRAQLWDEAAAITRRLTDDGRSSKNIQADTAGDRKTARFFDREGIQIAEYQMLPDGHLQRTNESGSNVLLSENVRFDDSTFEKNGAALKVRLILQAPVITREIRIATENEVFPRNYLN